RRGSLRPWEGGKGAASSTGRPLSRALGAGGGRGGGAAGRGRRGRRGRRLRRQAVTLGAVPEGGVSVRRGGGRYPQGGPRPIHWRGPRGTGGRGGRPAGPHRPGRARPPPAAGRPG